VAATRFVAAVAGALLIAVLAWAGGAAATPFRPSDDAQVLEQLPFRALSAATRVPVPRDPGSAAVIARAYIERSRRDGDPRFLGYAEGVLQPWWSQSAPPPPVLLLRATLLQSRHRFPEALRDLDALLAIQPGDAQALLTRATVLRVLGRYAEAGESCARLRGSVDEFVAALCAESVRGLNGDLRAAARALDAIAAGSAGQDPAVRTWYRAERAEMAERLGDDAGALALYRVALAEDPEDPLLRAAAADLLLRSSRPQEALDVAGQDPLADVLRLRTALALRALSRPRADLEAALSDSYAAAHRRNEDVHLREEARFSLEIAKDAPRALALAQQNWSVQREPADARLLKLAARAAGQNDAADPVREWLRESRLEDARLSP
jgi:tetratricopeptide (TPR) repeat protein